MESQHKLSAEEKEEQIQKWGHINDFLKKDSEKTTDFNHYKVRDHNLYERTGYSNNTNVNRQRRYDLDDKNIFKSIKKELEKKGFFEDQKHQN
ncbi:hypothetical protein JTF04_03405 [Mammaliicoccus vitulinus]|uniref:hypothetical protein n=1 Tax=Mammaliicoccus vitulinus TaxID=71237 RepID=UPI00194FBA93|nr:hypothetical protein [Mammaliicoccus vitulinus]MBM6628719.1 hypothetical protein [Mammaliicoccus vitulinus]MBO3076804.1 hypothetical protein [Mammaliicoccus vitulinus]MEB7656477.1 hypothetical protein [Mammaliicoccus vitulinus]WQK87079.1 hypothetical protein P3U62_08460 [Mammaliicoccus vitulinus]